MKIIKSIIALLTIFSLTTPALAYSTLYDYFIETQGYFPTIAERVPLAEANGIEGYRGTAEQNTHLLMMLGGEQFEVIEDAGDSLVLGAFNPTGGGTYRLKNSVGTTDTSVPLSTFKEPVSNIAYTMSYLNTTIGYGTIDPSTTRSEFISFSGITQNSDGSATLTGVTRGLTRTPAGSSCTASTTLAQRHPGQSVFILSDSPCLFQEYAVKRNNEAVTGAWTFPEPTASAHPATKNYVDTAALGGATVDKVTVAGTAGETISAGQIIYLDTIQDEWMLADASVAASTTNILLGVAQGTGTNGVAISGGVLLDGLDTNNVGGTAGNLIYLSDTAGATSTTAGTVDKIIGVVRSSAGIYFNPGAFIGLSDNTFSGANTFSGTDTFSGTHTFSGTLTLTGSTNIASSTVYATTTSGTWTKPSGLRFLIAEACGGGGGGGSATNAYTASGGGGGGSCLVEVIPASAIGATETVTIGAGGAAGAADGNPAPNGGATSFGSHFSAGGGTGGGAGGTLSSLGGAGGAGGTATGGDVNIPGGDGGMGMGPATGSAASLILGGAGGSSVLGGGAPANIAKSDTTATGGAGDLYGGGGAGSAQGTDTADRLGGAGAAGILILHYVFN